MNEFKFWQSSPQFSIFCLHSWNQNVLNIRDRRWFSVFRFHSWNWNVLEREERGKISMQAEPYSRPVAHSRGHYIRLGAPKGSLVPRPLPPEEWLFGGGEWPGPHGDVGQRITISVHIPVFQSSDWRHPCIHVQHMPIWSLSPRVLGSTEYSHDPLSFWDGFAFFFFWGGGGLQHIIFPHCCCCAVITTICTCSSFIFSGPSSWRKSGVMARLPVTTLFGSYITS